MKNSIKIMAAGLLMVSTASCDDLFDPAIENIRDANAMDTEAKYADAILGSAYILMPYSSGPVNDVATDDAVSNDLSNAWLTMAGGGWTSQTGVSTDNWRDRNASIQFLNLFLERVDNVPFSTTPGINQMFVDRLKGEALGLRALNMYYLLQNYGGKGTSGELLGVPIWQESYDATTDMNVARNTFAECMEALLKDVNEASQLLPTDFVDLSNNNQIPAKYAGLGVDFMDYNRVFGSTTWTRMSGRIAEAIGAQASLLAASPAFQGSGVEWSEAADYAARVIDRAGGLAGMAPDGHKWYTAEVIGNNTISTANHDEIIWRGGYEENSSIEGDNFPPSLYGKGRVNPTQNLVDAFPALNGYPISDPRSGYDKNDPYSNRDPRLDLYIVTNGSTLGVNNAIVETSTDAASTDGINKESGRSTRTGYYLRKLLRNDVNPNSTNEVKKYHYTKRIRYTEIFLAYAEAANEAWGPTGKGTHPYSAYDVIKAIRSRAGIGTANGDAYLEECKASKETMRTLIRNERRLELCFENIRFWDLRRWQADLKETARGASITGTSFNYIDVEPRNFADYMIYGPLPYGDILKFSNLEQNAGW
ncbi:MAG: RagB/SusD family nutrient uptake outer membrane protein [Muribaculaceae bacterium]|nr:RagB/SusD family nutrient uptake outer membrane protein [Muribaculaceae bacterium]